MRSPPPVKQKSNALSGRNWITEKEVKGLIAASKTVGRCQDRDSCMILLGFRHGLAVPRLYTCSGIRFTSIRRGSRCAERRRASPPCTS